MYSEIEDLYKRSLVGDKGAKEKLLLRLRPAILSSIKSIYNRYDQYDDLIQEGYEVILKCIKSYDFNKGSYFLGYVKLTLRFHYLNKYKTIESTVSLNQEIFDDGIELIDTIATDGLSQEDIAVNNEKVNKLWMSLKQLTDRQREIVTLYYIQQKPIRTIADKYDVSYRTVVNTKTTAINKLKKLMKDYLK